MQMDDEVTHMRVVDGALGGCLPGLVSFRIIGEDADDIELRDVLELMGIEMREFAAQYEMEKLLGHETLRDRTAPSTGLKSSTAHPQGRRLAAPWRELQRADLREKSLVERGTRREQTGMPGGSAIVEIGRAVMRGHAAARLVKDDVGGGEVPVALAVERKGRIRLAARDERDAIGDGIAVRYLHLGPGLRPCRMLEHGREGDHAAAFDAAAVADMDRASVELRALALLGLEELLRRRIEEDAEHGAARFHERDGDDEMRAALGEGPRAVYRVHDPDEWPGETRTVVLRLLGEPAIAGTGAAEPRMEKLVHLDIGFGDGRIVMGLGPLPVVRPVEAHGDGARFAHRFLHQREIGGPPLSFRQRSCPRREWWARWCHSGIRDRPQASC